MDEINKQCIKYRKKCAIDDFKNEIIEIIKELIKNEYFDEVIPILKEFDFFELHNHDITFIIMLIECEKNYEKAHKLLTHILQMNFTEENTTIIKKTLTYEFFNIDKSKTKEKIRHNELLYATKHFCKY